MSAPDRVADVQTPQRSPTRRALRLLGMVALVVALLLSARPLWSALRSAPPPAFAALPADGGAALLPDAPVRLGGHVAAVNGLSVSADGRYIASGSDDRSVDLCASESGLLHRTLRGPRRSVLGVAFSPDGRRLAAACGEMIWGKPDGVYVFDTESGAELAHLSEPPSASASVAWSPDGRFLAAGTGCALGSCETSIHLWDGATLRHRARLDGHDGAVGGVAFSPDSTRLASASADGSVRIWDPSSGAALARLDGHDAPVICVAYDGSGARLVSGGGHPLSGGDNHVLVWDAATGERQLTLRGHESTVFGVAFSPDGTCIASASGAAVPLPGGLRTADASLRLWDAVSGAPLAARRVEGPSGETLDGLWAVAFTPDGKRVLVAADDGRVLAFTLAARDTQPAPAH